MPKITAFAEVGFSSNNLHTYSLAPRPHGSPGVRILALVLILTQNPKLSDRYTKKIFSRVSYLIHLLKEVYHS